MTIGAHDVAAASTGDDEVMQEQSETTMDQSQGTFIVGTAEPTVNGTRTGPQLSRRSSGRCSEDIFVSRHLDSTSLHA